MSDEDIELAVDRRFIDVSDFYEIRYWADQLDVSVDDLRDAIGTVGNATTKVREYLDHR